MRFDRAPCGRARAAQARRIDEREPHRADYRRAGIERRAQLRIVSAAIRRARPGARSAVALLQRRARAASLRRLEHHVRVDAAEAERADRQRGAATSRGQSSASASCARNRVRAEPGMQLVAVQAQGTTPWYRERGLDQAPPRPRPASRGRSSTSPSRKPRARVYAAARLAEHAAERLSELDRLVAGVGVPVPCASTRPTLAGSSSAARHAAPIALELAIRARAHCARLAAIARTSPQPSDHGVDAIAIGAPHRRGSLSTTTPAPSPITMAVGAAVERADRLVAAERAELAEHAPQRHVVAHVARRPRSPRRSGDPAQARGSPGPPRTVASSRSAASTVVRRAAQVEPGCRDPRRREVRASRPMRRLAAALAGACVIAERVADAIATSKSRRRGPATARRVALHELLRMPRTRFASRAMPGVK